MSVYTNISSKWVKDINVRHKTMNYTEENIGTKFISLGLKDDFMNLIPKAKEIKAKIN